MMVLINNIVICNVLSVFGTAANAINMAVLYKQGLDTSINISFFGMALSDTCSLLTLLWYNVCFNPLLSDSGLPLDPIEFQHLTGCYPHDCFSRITGMIIMYVTAERCLCIMAPLRVKLIITPRRATMIVCFLYLLMFALLIPEYYSYYLDWKFFPARNKTLIGLVTRPHAILLESLTDIMYAVCLITSFISVVILTIILVKKLQQKEMWRMASTADKHQSDRMSTRNRKTIHMVVQIAAMLIVCYTPVVVVYVWTFLEPEFTTSGLYANLYFAACSVAQVFEAINSSFHIVLYYVMSSNYRCTLHQILPFKFGSQ
ncbi:unnamed protein product, partial [Lymnaea stagnalis]